MRLIGRSVGLVGVAALVVLVTAPSALAHATYKSSDPADESTVSSAPSTITAEFTEPMASGSYMDVTDPCGRDSGSGSSQTGSSMSVQNSSSAAGTYVVFWRAVSIDSHTTEGKFTFTSSGGEPCPGEKEDEAVDPGGGDGGGNGSGDAPGGGGDDASAASTDQNESGAGTRHERHSRAEREKRAELIRNRTPGTMRANGRPIAQGPKSDVPDAPSALEGIPLGGLLLTLGVSALIGAAAGKVYVSLSGDES